MGVQLGEGGLTLEDLIAVVDQDAPMQFSADARKNIDGL